MPHYSLCSSIAAFSLAALLASALLSLPSPAQAQHEPQLSTDAQLNISIAEMIQYTADFDAAMIFYRDQLGWPAVIEADGYALFDIYGSYRLALIDMKWDSAWQPGSPVPAPQLSVQTDSIEQSCAILEQRGWTVTPVIDPQGPMPVCTITDQAGHELVIWQDSASRQMWPLQANPVGMYGMAEMLIFVEDRARAEEFYKSTMDLQFVDSHDDHYVALTTKEGGFPLGLYEWAEWWDAPADGVPPAQPRLVIEARDIAAEHQRISGSGATCGELKGEPTDLQWFCVTDPDGQRVTFWQFDAANAEPAPVQADPASGWPDLRARIGDVFAADYPAVMLLGESMSDQEFLVLDQACRAAGAQLIWVDRLVPIKNRQDIFTAFDACLSAYTDFDQDMAQLGAYLDSGIQQPQGGVVFYFRDLQSLSQEDNATFTALLDMLNSIGEGQSAKGRLFRTLVEDAPAVSPQ